MEGAQLEPAILGAAATDHAGTMSARGIRIMAPSLAASASWYSRFPAGIPEM
jgi:hypothetical protein